MHGPRLGAVIAMLLSATAAAAVEIPRRGTDQIAHFCMVAFGGPERWNEVRDVRFTQVVTRYRPGNQPYKERAAEVYLRLRPRRQCRIEAFTEDGEPRVIIYDGNDVQVLTDGKPDADGSLNKRALHRALSTLYLAELPFNLDDPDVDLTYRGEVKVQGRDTYHLRARVRGEMAFSPADRYDYYIDQETYQVPQLVYTNSSEGVSYVVRWSELRNLDGILRPVRWDYMASPRQKATSIEYKNLRLNPGLADSLFQITPASTGAPPPRSPRARSKSGT